MRARRHEPPRSPAGRSSQSPPAVTEECPLISRGARLSAAATRAGVSVRRRCASGGGRPALGAADRYEPARASSCPATSRPAGARPQPRQAPELVPAPPPPPPPPSPILPYPPP